MATTRRRTKKKNPAAVALGRLGGLVMTDAKREANRVRVKKRWAMYRAAAKKGEGK